MRVDGVRSLSTAAKGSDPGSYPVCLLKVLPVLHAPNAN